MGPLPSLLARATFSSPRLIHIAFILEELRFTRFSKTRTFHLTFSRSVLQIMYVRPHLDLF